MRWRPTFRPLGRTHMPVTAPTGSGSAATSLSPLIMEAMTLSESVRRSMKAAAWPWARAAVHVPAVFRLDVGLALLEQFRHPEDHLVFDPPGQGAQAPGRGFGFPGHMMNQFWDIHGSTPSNLLA